MYLQTVMLLLRAEGLHSWHPDGVVGVLGFGYQGGRWLPDRWPRGVGQFLPSRNVMAPQQDGQLSDDALS